MARQAEPVSAQYRAVFRFVRRRASSRLEAEDITQEAFASAAEMLARSANAAPPTLAWLYTVARRRLIDQRRRYGPQTVPLDTARETGVRDDYGGLVARTLDAALVSLSEAEHRVVVLRLLEGWTFNEIASKVGATEEACRMRFMRGLRHIRAEFEKEGLSP